MEILLALMAGVTATMAGYYLGTTLEKEKQERWIKKERNEWKNFWKDFDSNFKKEAEKINNKKSKAVKKEKC